MLFKRDETPPTYPGMGMSLVPRGFVTEIKTREQECSVIDEILGRSVNDRREQP